MTQAEILVRQIHDDLSAVEESLRAHPYPLGFHDGSLSPDALTPFLGHQYHIAFSDLRSAALAIHRFGDQASATFFKGFLDGEFAALDGIRAMAQKIGLSEADLVAYEPSAEGFAYGAYVCHQANHGSAAEIMCGFLVNLAAWGHNCGQIGEGLRAHYGWGPGDTAFVDSFAALPSFEDQALPVIQEGLDHGEDPVRIARTARLIQSYEKMFWDAMAKEVGLDPS